MISIRWVIRYFFIWPHLPVDEKNKNLKKGQWLVFTKEKDGFEISEKKKTNDHQYHAILVGIECWNKMCQ